MNRGDQHLFERTHLALTDDRHGGEHHADHSQQSHDDAGDHEVLGFGFRVEHRGRTDLNQRLNTGDLFGECSDDLRCIPKAGAGAVGIGAVGDEADSDAVFERQALGKVSRNDHRHIGVTVLKAADRDPTGECPRWLPVVARDQSNRRRASPERAGGKGRIGRNRTHRA